MMIDRKDTVKLTQRQNILDKQSRRLLDCTAVQKTGRYPARRKACASHPCMWLWRWTLGLVGSPRTMMVQSGKCLQVTARHKYRRCGVTHSHVPVLYLCTAISKQDAVSEIHYIPLATPGATLGYFNYYPYPQLCLPSIREDQVNETYPDV